MTAVKQVAFPNDQTGPIMPRETKLAGLARTQARLTEFEWRYGMSSAEFERRLNAREIEETFEFTDWRMELGMLTLLQRKYATLHEAQFVD